MLTLAAALADTDARYAAGDHLSHLATLRRFAPVISRTTPAHQATWAAWMGFLHSVTGARPQVARQYCQRSATLAAAHGLHNIQGMALSCLTQQAYILGDLVAGQQAGTQALAIFTAQGNHLGACRTLWHLSTIANAQSAWLASRRYGQQALCYAEHASDARALQVSRWRLGGLAILSGHVEQGLRQCESVLAEGPAPTDRAMTQVMQGCGLVKAGDVRAGIAALEPAVLWLDQAHLRYTHTQASLYLGEGYVAAESIPQARRLFMDLAIASQQAGYRVLEFTARQRWRQTFTAYDPLFYQGDTSC